MYVSDYGFATEPSSWTLTMDKYNDTSATSTNWLYVGLYEWTISRYADRSDNAFYVRDTGNVNYRRVYYHSGVRPSFNLESSITYVSGSGSANDPILINQYFRPCLSNASTCQAIRAKFCRSEKEEIGLGRTKGCRICVLFYKSQNKTDRNVNVKLIIFYQYFCVI